MRSYVLVLLLGLSCTQAEISKYAFPDNFAFGAASASYQVEGAWNEDGKGENIWDWHLHNNPNISVADNSNGDIAADAYHKYKEDVALLKNLGVNFYRFSISWSRILPTGKIDQVNQLGIDYYNRLINELLDNGIEPYVTIYHWDLPMPLQLEGGWLNRKIIDYFVDYSRVVFKNFGDRVKFWIPFNEINQICEAGYSGGSFAPFYKNEGIGGYECAHMTLLAHSEVYEMYTNEFKPSQNGQIGIAIDAFWHEPNIPGEPGDMEASQRDMLMSYGWYSFPIIHGDYPEVMKKRIAKLSAEEGRPSSRLPSFTKRESQMLKGSIDFLGLNHYSSDVVWLAAPDAGSRPSHWADIGVESRIPDEWGKSASGWLNVCAPCFHKLLVWIRDNLGNPPVLITENGFSDLPGEINDKGRVDYMNEYLDAILTAIYEDKVNVIGYTAWSLMDNFEWMAGYTQRFGLVSVDFDSPNRTRTPKASYYVFKNIIETRHLDWDLFPNQTFVQGNN